MAANDVIVEAASASAAAVVVAAATQVPKSAQDLAQFDCQTVVGLQNFIAKFAQVWVHSSGKLIKYYVAVAAVLCAFLAWLILGKKQNYSTQVINPKG